MKLVHLSDLHIGKRLNNYSLLEDQEYIFKQIIEKLEEIKPQATLIAGDIFDRSNPSEESTILYDKFITGLRNIAPVYIIAGNHDSGQRLELFKNSLHQSGIHISGKCTKEIDKFTIEEDGECVNLYLVPFFSPREISLLLEEEFETYEQAFIELIKDLDIKEDEVNILMAHQLFVNTSKNMDENEQQVIEIGELEQISIQHLENFDYIALGHLHNSQHLKNTNAYYCGTPMKYTINDRDKYFNVVDINEGKVEVERVKLEPLRDLKVLEGDFSDIILHEDSDDYIIVNLTDKKVVDNAKRKLQEKFPHILQLKFNAEVESTWNPQMDKILEEQPVDLLESFYKARGREFSLEEREIATEMFEFLESESNEAT